MSSTPPATTDPTSPVHVSLGPVAPIETAPSATVAEGPTTARVVGFVGVFLFVLGMVVVVATRAIPERPRWVPEWVGMLSGALGLALMLYHAVTDGEQEVRRLYGMLAAVLLVAAVAFGFLPGPFESAGVAKTVGYYLMPWGLVAGLLSLLFAVPFTRHETNERLRDISLYVLLGMGGLLTIGVVVWGQSHADFLANPGLALALLGVGFICAYLSQVDTSDGIGYAVAFTFGVVGGAILFYVFARAVFPTVLHEGPNVLRKADQSLDKWKVIGRVLVVLAALGVVALGVLGRFPRWLRATLAGLGIVVAGVFLAASFGTQLSIQPQPYLVPGGLILAALGLVYLSVSVGVCSDSQFVTLTRRELSAYFFSPIGYFVLAGMAVAEWIGYRDFTLDMVRQSAGGRGIAFEPIVRGYIVSIFPVFALTLMVPALTMRLLSEEKQRGSLEVLLTAPINEWTIVVSKFLATWLFFMICWLPAGLFLIAFRVEGGAPFDYRPLLGFYVALGATGAAFVAVGLFFSAITKHQIVAAVLTFVVMCVFLMSAVFRLSDIGLGKTVQLILIKVSYLALWAESLSGQLPIRDVIMWMSLAIFFIFLSIKVLEIRRWS